MKPIHTVALLVVFLLLGGYVFFFEQGPKPPDETDFKPKDSILGFSFADLTEVTLSQGSEKLVLAQAKADEWTMTAPKVGPADATQIKEALMPLSSWQAMDTLAETLEVNKKKDFGLEPPAMTLSVKLKSGTQEAYIGNKTPTNTGYYVMVKGNPKLFLSFTSVPESLEKLLKSPPVPTPTPKPSVETPSATGSAVPSLAPMASASPH